MTSCCVYALKQNNGTDITPVSSSSSRPTSSYITDQISSSSDTPTERSYGTTSTASSDRRCKRESYKYQYTGERVESIVSLYYSVSIYHFRIPSPVEVQL